MEIGEETVEKLLSPIGRARCNTWHAGLEPLSGSSSVSHSPVLPESPPSAVVDHYSGVKKTPSRRNAWGTASYADLIATAIESSPDRRLTLSQIYDWIVTNVQYFSDKADNNSSAGWKNSIRHNLSLHRRFVRVPHSDGKSAWWTIGGCAGGADASALSGVRWSRNTGGTRNRADTLDSRSYSSSHQQRQRRNSRKTAASESVDRRSSDKKPCLEVNTVTSTTKTTSFSFGCVDGLIPSLDDVFASSDGSSGGAGVDDSLSNYFSECGSTALTSSGRHCLNSDSFLSGASSSSAFQSDASCVENLAPSEWTLSSSAYGFGSKHGVSLSASVPLSIFNNPLTDDDSSNAMITQLSPSLASWSHDAENSLFANDVVDDVSAACPMIDDRLSELFSDVAMSHDENSVTSLLTHGSVEAESDILHGGDGFVVGQAAVAFDDDRPRAAAASPVDAALLAALTSTIPSLRRGSDAPPPSPESAASDTDDRDDPNLYDILSVPCLKSNLDTSVSVACGSKVPFAAVGWTNLFPLIKDDVSSLSDMDMDH